MAIADLSSQFYGFTFLAVIRMSIRCPSEGHFFVIVTHESRCQVFIAILNVRYISEMANE